MENFIKENVCNKVISCNECREKFEMPYGECCLFCCNHNSALCEKCNNGIFHEKYNEL